MNTNINKISTFGINPIFMKNLLLLTGLLVLFSCQQNTITTEQFTDTNGFTYEAVSNDPTGLRLYTLDNGLKVYLSKNQDEPKIQTFIGVRAGSVYDPADNTGLAHYLEHMLFKGTDQYGTQDWEKEKTLLKQISDLYEAHKAETDPEKKKEIYRQIDAISLEASTHSIANEFDKMMTSIGAEGVNAWTSFEETVYQSKIQNTQLDKWIMLEKERMSKLVLRLFHTELEAVYEEFNRAQDNDGRKLLYTLLDAVFPTHPYGQQTTIGKSEHLKNPSLEAINNYFETYYVPNNMAIVLVGDLEFDSTIEKINAAFGTLESKPLTHPEQPVEAAITAPVEVEVFGPDQEVVEVAFRSKGIGSDDEKYLRLIDMILSNSTAGLMDLNLNQKKRLQSAVAYSRFFNDYGMIELSGTPKKDQTLEEVKDLLLSQIEEIKKGNFEDWLTDAVVNDLKVSEIRQYERATNVAYSYVKAFTQFQKWEDRVRFLEDIEKISKQDIVNFANTFFADNYVVAYKRQGEATGLVKVDKPEITPIHLNRDKKSDFLVDFLATPSEDIQPLFIDYDKAILKDQTTNNIEIASIENQTNSLASLDLIFDMGSDHIKLLPYALGYLDYLGTSKYDPEALKKEFYKLGIEFYTRTGDDQVRLGISGLQENLEEGLALMEHVIRDLKADQEAYEKYVERIAKSRENTKSSKGEILWSGLMSYLQYGENSRLRNVPKLDELRQIDPQTLVDLIKSLPDYKHRFFYYGKDLEVITQSINRVHEVNEPLKDYPAPLVFEEKENTGAVYFVNYDMVQSEILMVNKGQTFDAQRGAAAAMYGTYFGQGLSSIVFQEIRESRSLAYSAASIYSQNPRAGKPDYLLNYIGTQADKIPLAVKALNELLADIPYAKEQFEAARTAGLKKIEAERITKAQVFWTYERLQKRGINHDIRKDTYERLKSFEFEDLQAFFETNVKNNLFDIAIIGNRKDVNFKELSKMGELKELDVDYLFNF